MQKQKILFVLSAASFFDRLDALFRYLLDHEFDVRVAVPEHVSASSPVQVHAFSLVRGSMNPLKEIKTLVSLGRLVWQIKPDFLHLFTIKPIFYGSLLSQFLGRHIVVNSFTGLGHLYTAPGIKVRLIRGVLSLVYRFSLANPRLWAIFQNPTDRDWFVEKHLLPAQRTVLIGGEGLDLTRFPYRTKANNPPTIALIARLLGDKGVYEFIKTAQRIRATHDVRCVLIGNTDVANPSAISKEQLQAWHDQNIVEWWGWCEVDAELYDKIDIVCLPSYREGLPAVLLEAAASGCAIVTTDVPGCRDVVSDQINGLLIPPGDVDGLTRALVYLIEHPEERQRFAQAARSKIEGSFASEPIHEQFLEVYSNSCYCASHGC